MNTNLRYLFLKFLNIGAVSWGGYMALIAIIQKQISEADKVIEEEKIVHAISLASVLPGPVAVNVVAYIGYELKGIKGALVSITAVLIPCFILMMVLCYVYFNYGNLPAFNNFFAGITPAVAALLVSVAFTMAKKNIKDVAQTIIAIFALLSIFFIHFSYTTILVLIFSGVAGYFLYKNNFQHTTSNEKNDVLVFSKKSYFTAPIIFVVLLFIILTAAYFLSGQNPTVQLYKQIILTFSGLSISQFGGGYVVVPAMQKIIVDSLHWLTNKEFADAIAMGQITPGPIYISAAFIGFKLQGIAGALVATIAMFLPAAGVMLLCAKFMNLIIASLVVKACFKGITAAVTGMIAAAGCTIFYQAHNLSFSSVGIFIISLILFIKFKVNPVYVILLAGIAGSFLFNKTL